MVNGVAMYDDKPMQTTPAVEDDNERPDAEIMTMRITTANRQQLISDNDNSETW